MTDYNSIKAAEFAQRQGEMDWFDNEVNRVADECYEELPAWVKADGNRLIVSVIMDEAKRRVMQAIKERGEP